MESSKMKKHVTIVGSLQIGFSALGLMAAVAIFIALSFARAFVGDDDVPQTVLRFLSISLPILIGSFSMLGLIAGIGLLVYKSWARYIVIILSIIGCVNIPIGTAKGIYSIWVLIQDDTVKLFTKEDIRTGNVEPVLVS
jgi:O-antigen/teichoic acid export membrane protein